ncbi:hypothetical protein SBV1_1570018 [Verrucomicrobia bacterium]|nr:hypothetical protein SBV1_1570018 [Verrucomicrobiota bacterium]
MKTSAVKKIPLFSLLRALGVSVVNRLPSFPVRPPIRLPFIRLPDSSRLMILSLPLLD